MSRSRKSQKSSTGSRRAKKQRHHVGESPSPFTRRLHVEQLEDRRMLAVITVDSLLDNFNPGAPTTDGLITLREAILAANTNAIVGDAPAGSVGADTIDFDATVFTGGLASLIRLGGTELTVTEALTIDGSTGTDVVITADAMGNDMLVAGTFITDVDTSGSALLDDNSRIFNITAAGDFTFAGLTLTGGRTTGNNDTFPDSTFNGGAIRSFTTGSLTIDQSTISGNSTTGDDADGGGIYSLGAVTLNSSTVSGNSVSGFAADGGGIFTYFGTVTLNNSIVSGNSSLGGGGADGGGINTRSGAITLNSSTVTGNLANSRGGGIFVFDSATNPALTIDNSIVAGNTDNGTAVDLRPDPESIVTINYSLIGIADGLVITGNVGNLTGTAAIPLDPLLGPLQDNGGPTETHALLAGSPAIDTGDPGFSSPPEFDQRGAPFARVVGGRIDIGAVEVQPIIPSADFDSSGFVTGLDFLAWQRGFGTPAPTAAKTDGDADNDGDVDSVDLGFWESQFGGPAPLLALSTVSSPLEAFSSQQSAFSLEQAAPAPSATELPTLSAAELTNAAQAWELALEVGTEEEPLLDNRSTTSALSAVK